MQTAAAAANEGRSTIGGNATDFSAFFPPNVTCTVSRDWSLRYVANFSIIIIDDIPVTSSKPQHEGTFT